MKIVVLVKEVPDTYGERKLDLATGYVDRAASDAVIDEVGERALEAALSYKDANKETEVVALSMGPETVTKALRKALAMGATSAVHILDDSLAGADLLRTSSVLAAALRKIGFDLVVAGNESTDGRGGVVPAMIAEHLDVPHLTYLNTLAITAGAVSGERSGEGCAVHAQAGLPAVISVSERTPEARFPGFKGIMMAKKKPLSQWSLADLEAAPAAAGTQVLSVKERPARAGGTKIFDDGNAAEQLAEYLAAGRLI